MKHCLADGQRVTVAVVDRSGSAKVLIEADGSGPHTVHSSIGKAFTSASMGRDTTGLADFMKDHRDLDGLRSMVCWSVVLGSAVRHRARSIQGARAGIDAFGGK